MAVTPQHTPPQQPTADPVDGDRRRLIETYRRKAKHYDIVSQLFPVPGYPQLSQRRQAVRALRLRPGATVIDMACGTGLNFSLIQQAIGPDGHLIGVDLTDAMLAVAERRIERNRWSNVSLVQADAGEFSYPAQIDAVVSTYAMSHLPDAGAAIAHGAAALAPDGRWVVLDLKVPDDVPLWVARLGIALGRPLGSIDEWVGRRPWEGLRAAMEEELADLTWTELFFGTAFLAAGARG
jgi:ubiquinone/menaquinone biosynthesis C-methylase UbiE